jgi:hypothetical protein
VHRSKTLNKPILWTEEIARSQYGGRSLIIFHQSIVMSLEKYYSFCLSLNHNNFGCSGCSIHSYPNPCFFPRLVQISSEWNAMITSVGLLCWIYCQRSLYVRFIPFYFYLYNSLVPLLNRGCYLGLYRFVLSNALFAWAYQPNQLAIQQCFSLTINQRTVLSAMAY